MQKSSSGKNSLRSFMIWASFVVASLWLSGCVTPTPFYLDPASVDRVGEVNVMASVPADAISIEVAQSGYGAGGGLIGAIIDSAVTSSRKNSAEETVKPLLEATKDVNLRDDLLNAMTPMLKELAWPKVLDVKMDKVSRAITATDVKDNSVLELYTRYQLSTTAEVLEMRTGFAYYVIGNPKAVSAGAVHYASKRIGTETDENEAAIKLWADNNAAAYREALNLGVAETTKMLGIVLPTAGRKIPARPIEKKVSMRVRLTHGRGDFGIKFSGTALTGWILEERQDRVLFQSEDGPVYSFPPSDIIKRLTP
jgi:hypothetical protein